MIEDAKRKKIQAILVKDFSRLGRNYITVGDYIEQIFPLLGIRLISVNDGYDSKADPAGSLESSFTNLVNTLYSRDISRKVKSGNYTRYQNGTKQTNRVPYGYRKAGTEWVIDQEAADVVRLIFEEAGKGKNTTAIATMLNKRNILTRAEYQRTHGMKLYGQPVAAEHERRWTSAMVASVLGTYAYTGALIGGTLEAVSVGSHKVRRKPKDEWITLDGNHAPIISLEEYEKAQAVLVSREREKCNASQTYPLKGKIRCGNCHRAMTYISNSRGKYFYCQHRGRQGEFTECPKERYPVSEVESAVLESLAVLIERVKGLKKGKTEDTESLALIDKRLEELKDEKLKLYEMYVDRVIGKEEYLERKDKIQEKIETLESETAELRQEEKKRLELNQAVDDALYGIKSTNKLTPEMEGRFIEAVYVYGPGKIEIMYRLDDMIRRELGM